MTEANHVRGEIAVELEGVEYSLRPSYQALVAIEQQTERSVQQLAIMASNGSISIENAAIVVTECIKAQGRAVDDKTLAGFNAKTVGQELIATGMMHIYLRIETLLLLASSGGYTSQGELKTQTVAAPTQGDV